MCKRTNRGQTLAEIVVAMSILAVTCLVVLPTLTTMAERAALTNTTSRIRDILRLTREEAMTLQLNRAVKFLERDGAWWYAIYNDGDGDGVRNADIVAGVDHLADGPWMLISPHALATLRIPGGGLPHPDGGPRLLEGEPAVRFNGSTLCSFAYDGSGTPGTVYIASARGTAAAVRCAGDGGNIRIMYRRPGSRRWITE